MRRFQITVTAGEDFVWRAEAVPGLSFGRRPSNACVIPERSVSGVHAQLIEVGGELWIEDVGSGNKTRVRGGPILGVGQRTPLESGMVLSLGRARIDVLELSSEGGGDATYLQSGGEARAPSLGIRGEHELEARDARSAGDAPTRASSRLPESDTVQPGAPRPTSHVVAEFRDASPENDSVARGGAGVAGRARDPLVDSDAVETKLPPSSASLRATDSATTVQQGAGRGARDLRSAGERGAEIGTERSREREDEGGRPRSDTPGRPAPGASGESATVLPGGEAPDARAERPLEAIHFTHADDSSLARLSERARRAMAARRGRLVFDDDGLRAHVPLELPELVLGRSRHADLRVPHEGVSSQHCRIWFDGANETYLLEDLDSSNGTEIAGQRLMPNQPAVLQPESHLRIGPLGALFVTDLDAQGKPLPTARYELAVKILVAGASSAESVEAIRAAAAETRDGLRLGERLVLSGAVSAWEWSRAWAQARGYDSTRDETGGGWILPAILVATAAALGVLLWWATSA